MARSLAIVSGSFAVGLLLALSLAASTGTASSRALLRSSAHKRQDAAAEPVETAEPAAPARHHEMSSSSSSSSYSSPDARIEMTSETVSSYSNHDDDDDKFERSCSFIKHEELEATLRFVVCGGGKKKACPRDFPAPLYIDGLPGTINPSFAGFPENGGFGLNMWASVVNRAGRVCAVATSGPKFDSAWTYARVNSAIKASTANGFSTDKLAMASGNLFTLTSQSGQMFGLADALSVDASAANAGSVDNWGESCTSNDDDEDPLCGARLGGVSTVGGGLALYNKHGKKLGALGVAGDCPCTDHIVAWKVRFLLEMDHVTSGVGVAQRFGSGDGNGLEEAFADNLVLNSEFDTSSLPNEAQIALGLGDFVHGDCDAVSNAIIQQLDAAGTAVLPPFRRLHPASNSDDSTSSTSTSSISSDSTTSDGWTYPETSTSSSSSD